MSEYTELSKPLTESLKGGKPGSELIEWTEEMEDMFVSIKETLASCLALCQCQPALSSVDLGGE